MCKHKMTIVGSCEKGKHYVFADPLSVKKGACAIDVTLLTGSVNMCILFHVRQISALSDTT